MKHGGGPKPKLKEKYVALQEPSKLPFDKISQACTFTQLHRTFLVYSRNDNNTLVTLEIQGKNLIQVEAIKPIDGVVPTIREIKPHKLEDFLKGLK